MRHSIGSCSRRDKRSMSGSVSAMHVLQNPVFNQLPPPTPAGVDRVSAQSQSQSQLKNIQSSGCSNFPLPNVTMDSLGSGASALYSGNGESQSGMSALRRKIEFEQNGGQVQMGQHLHAVPTPQ